MEKTALPSHYGSADEPTLRDRSWIEQQWDLGRLNARDARAGAVLVMDEIQKVPDWSAVVKRLWDEDTRKKVALKVVLLGSSPLLIQTGLAESLAGRFEIIPAPHWSFREMRWAFGWDLETFIYYGAYPGAATLIDDPERWRRYINDSLVETTISRDILLLTRIDKPALLRRLFHLVCGYSGQVLSYQKMIGQLQDADGDFWGRLVESAVGAHLLNGSPEAGIQISYWRERGHEVDFILSRGKTAVALEVKSGRHRESLAGMDVFSKQFHPKRKLLIGPQGVSLTEFFSKPPAHWLS